MVTVMPKIIASEVKELEFRQRTVKGTSLYVTEAVLSNIADHADEGYLDNKEIMGLMMGSAYRDDEGEYVIVTGTATSKLDSNEVSVRFNKESLEQLFGSIDRCRGVIVGWYHSHPGYGCYLSDIDIKTHEGIFRKDIGFAIVVDPADSTIIAFQCVDGEPNKVPMLIMDSD